MFDQQDIAKEKLAKAVIEAFAAEALKSIV